MTTNHREAKHQAAEIVWGERIKNCEKSGKTIKQWCIDNGVTMTSYYAWRKRIEAANTATQKPRMEVKSSKKQQAKRSNLGTVSSPIENVDVSMTFGNASVTIRRTADNAMVETLLRLMIG